MNVERHEMMLKGCNAVAAMDGKATYPSGRAPSPVVTSSRTVRYATVGGSTTKLSGAIRTLLAIVRPSAILIPHTLRRIGHNEIDNLVRQRTQYARAITLKNLIDREHGGASASIGGIADARPQSRRAQRSRIEDRRRRRVRLRTRP